MKLGNIVRADDRGLGIQTWEAHRALKPHATVIVTDPGYAVHLDRYPQGTLVVPNVASSFNSSAVVKAFRDCDIVYSCETLYDWKIADDFKRLGIKTVVHMNPELWPHFSDIHLPHPSQWWVPTPWRLEHLPFSTRYVPIPVATDRFNYVNERTDRYRVLHVVGYSALADRNGTVPFLNSLKHLKNVDVTMTLQGANVYSYPKLGAGTTFKLVNSTENYWDLYRDQDLLVLPRRYGGLCLPTQEALAAGLQVAMTDIPPQSEIWPIISIPATSRGTIICQGGAVQAYDADPAHIAIKIQEAAKLAKPNNEWAAANSWEALLPLYEREFERVLEG